MTESHFAVLRLIASHRLIGRAYLRELLDFDPKHILFKLRAERLIDGENDNGAMNYWIEPKGKRLLATMDAATGEIAGMRRAVSNDTYTGEKESPMREGAFDGYLVPTLDHNGNRVERRRPILIGGKVEAVRQGRS